MAKKTPSNRKDAAIGGPPMKRQIKATVFTDFFGQPKNAILLYRFLHPEDASSTEKDVQIITLENVLTDNLQNDLGILVGDKLMILVEHQEKWDPNVAFRSFFYLGHSYNEYFKIHNIDLHCGKKIGAPKPELYVLFTGKRKNIPKQISLHDEFFPGTKKNFDVVIDVITDGKPGDVVSQYVEFAHICKELYELYRNPRIAAREIVRTCIERNILREYLLSKEKEIVDIMISLFDAQEVQERFISRIKSETWEEAEKATEARMNKVFRRREVRLKKAVKEAVERTKIEEAKVTAKELLANTQLSIDVIVGSVRLPVAEVEKLADAVRRRGRLQRADRRFDEEL